jgi:hypothetical protein
MKKKLSMTPSAIRARKFRADNPGYSIEAARKWRKANPERARELSRKSNKKWREANPEKAREKARAWREDNLERARFLVRRNNKKIKKASATSYEVSLKHLFSQTKSRAKLHKRGFNIDLQYLLDLWKSQKGRCNLSNLKMTTGIGTLNAKVSIDRISSKKGYVKGNCQLVRSDINIAKSDLEQKEFIKLCKAIAKNN